MIESKNPFKGPKSYEEGDVLYGREQETFELINSIGSNTLTLLYSKSGIGKTSLIYASLLSALKQTGEYLPVVFRLGGFINYKTSSHNFSDFLVKEIRNLLKSKYSIVLPPQNVPDSLFELLYLANFHDALEVKSNGRKNRAPLIPVIFLDQLEVIFTLDLQEGDLPHFMRELRYVIEGEFPEYLIDYYNPGKDPASIEMDKFLEIQDGIRCNVKPFRVVLSFREEYLFDFENFSNLIPSIRFAASRYRLSPFSRYVASNIILATSEKRIDESQAAKIIDNLLPRNTGNFRHEEIDPFLLSLVCNQLWDQVILGRVEITRNIIDNVIDNYIEKVYSQISDKAKKFIESYLVTVDNKRTLFSFELAALWHISATELNSLIENPDMRLLNKEMYLDSYHVQILHDRLVPPIASRKKEREEAEAKLAQEQIKAEQGKLIRQQYEAKIQADREERRKIEERQKKRRRVFWFGFLMLGVVFTLFELKVSNDEADDKAKFMALNNEADMKVTEFTNKKGISYFDTLGVHLLAEAASKYDSALLFVNTNLNSYEKLLEVYGKLIRTNKNYRDSIISTYKKGILADARFSVLFPRVLREVGGYGFAVKGPVLDVVVGELLALDSIYLTRDDGYYRTRANDLYSHEYDSLAASYITRVKTFGPDDYVLISQLRRESSMEYLGTCLTKYPKSCACMISLSDEYTLLGDFANAKQTLNKAFETAKDCKILAAYGLLDIYERARDYKSASPVYHYLVMGPDSTNAQFLNNAAWNLATYNQELDFAKQLSLKSVRISPSCNNCWDTLAEIYFQLDDYRLAKEASLKSVALGHKGNKVRMGKIEAALWHGD